MRAFHESWFWVAVVTTGLAGSWGLTLGLTKRAAPRAFVIARWVAMTAMAIQVSAGLILYGQGWRPANGFHVFYGIVIVFTFAFAYIYRIQLERRPELGYGLLLLFVMGLGFRAWSNVF
jgi:CHASE2 domain-containing sensor protein